MRVSKLALLSLLTVTGCIAAPDDSSAPATDAEPTGEAEESILGTTRFINCSVDQQNLLLESARFMRVGVNSAAFRQCVDRGMRTGITVNGSPIGPYFYCNGDPYQNDTLDQRITRVLNTAAASANNMVMECSPSGVDGNAQTGQNDGLYHNNDETMQWNGPWITAIYNSLTQPVCTGPDTPAGCRWAAYPWPYPQLGAIALHEASHTHGYGHGDNNDNTAAANACGTTSVAGWDFQSDTVPYLIGACLSEVLMESAAPSRCGATLTSSSCRADQLYIETAPGASTCTCVDDPRLVRVGSGATQMYIGRYGAFATDPANGNIRRYNGPDSWTTIGGPGAMFAVNDSSLYGLTPDRQSVWQYSGSGSTWTQIGGPATSIYAGGGRLYATHPGTGNILRYNGSANNWTLIGGPGAGFAVTIDGTLYGLTPDRQAVMRYWEGAFGTSGWTQVGGAAGRIVGGGHRLYATSPSEWSLMQFDGSSWTYVGTTSPYSTIVANDTTVYSGDTIGGSLYRYTGSVWEMVANRPSGFWAGGHSLFLTRPGLGVYRMVSP